MRMIKGFRAGIALAGLLAAMPGLASLPSLDSFSVIPRRGRRSSVRYRDRNFYVPHQSVRQRVRYARMSGIPVHVSADAPETPAFGDLWHSLTRPWELFRFERKSPRAKSGQWVAVHHYA